nr:hypothetical protein [Tanacetum cinerariifolium]
MGMLESNVTKVQPDFLAIEDDVLDEPVGVGGTTESTKCLTGTLPALECVKLEDVVKPMVREHGFLSQKGSVGGRGVKEKNKYVVAKDGVSPSVTDETVVKEKHSSLVDTSIPTAMVDKLSSLDDTIVLGSFPPLSTRVTTTADNALGKSLYVNVTGKPNGKKLNIRTLFTPECNRIDVVVLVESIRAISERFANTGYGFFLGKRVAYPIFANYVRNTLGSMEGLDDMLENGPWFIQNNPLILKKWHPDENILKEDVYTVHGRSSYARVMIELRADVKLKDNIVVAMPKITKEGHYICAGEKTTLKKPSQTSRGVPLGLKMGFKPHKEYIHVPKKPTASSSGNKMKGVEPTIEVSNSNPFKVLDSIDNDVKLGTNGGTINLVNNEATSSGSSYMNVDNSSTGTTPIIDKIEKFEELITSGQAILVDEASNPLKKVEFLGDYDSEDEVASVDNDMALERVSFGTQSLLERWMYLYGNGDYDEDIYDDDMYEGQDLPQELQAICNNLDIRVRGRKMK